MRERLRQLGGTLDVQSNAKAQGMTVTALLPAEVAPPPMEARSASGEQSRGVRLTHHGLPVREGSEFERVFPIARS